MMRMPKSCRRVLAILVAWSLVFLPGCYHAATNSVDSAGQDTSQRDASPRKTPRPLDDSSTHRSSDWNLQLEKTRKLLQQEALEQSQQSLAKLKEMPIELSSEQTAQLRGIESQLNLALEARIAREQNEELALASELAGLGKFNESLAAIVKLLEGNLGEDVQRRALELKSFITDHREDAERLSQAMQMLAREDRADVLEAQNALFEHPQPALSMLEQSTRSANATLVRNSLQMLGKLDRPEATLPMMVDVLRRPAQQQNWPDASREIELAHAIGAGEPLLNLVLSSEWPEQRIAALLCLSKVVDPPQRTVVELLPLLDAQGPELPAALAAVGHAVHVHHQHDLATRRGLEFDITPEQSRRLDALPGLLSQIISGEGQEPSAVRAAMKLGIVTRQIPAEPLRRVKVLGFAAEMDDGRAAAVVDGVWNTVDPKLMWRYPVNKTGSIILDLGKQRTIAGVRIWNLNESGGTHRGWKDVHVFVGNAPAELVSPAATGFVPAAPGVVDAPNYSVTVPLDFVPARYVRLEAETLWRQDAHSGLTEIQVLGF